MTLREAALAENPLIAILRGLEPENAIAVADVLVDAGFKFIEVPLNSPEPLKSIRLIADKYGKTVVVGAGTVLSPDDVANVVEVGGQLIVAPNMNPGVGIGTGGCCLEVFSCRVYSASGDSCYASSVANANGNCNCRWNHPDYHG